jgi:hypothetical protein
MEQAVNDASLICVRILWFIVIGFPGQPAGRFGHTLRIASAALRRLISEEFRAVSQPQPPGEPRLTATIDSPGILQAASRPASLSRGFSMLQNRPFSRLTCKGRDARVTKEDARLFSSERKRTVAGCGIIQSAKTPNQRFKPIGMLAVCDISPS